MNRLKKELRKKGIKLECDYPILPDNNGIQGIGLDSQNMTYHIYHTSIHVHYDIDRQLNLVNERCD